MNNSDSVSKPKPVPSDCAGGQCTKNVQGHYMEYCAKHEAWDRAIKQDDAAMRKPTTNKKLDEALDYLLSDSVSKPTEQECPSCNGTGTEADYVGLEMRCVGAECSRCAGKGAISLSPACICEHLFDEHDSKVGWCTHRDYAGEGNVAECACTTFRAKPTELSDEQRAETLLWQLYHSNGANTRGVRDFLFRSKFPQPVQATSSSEDHHRVLVANYHDGLNDGLETAALVIEGGSFLSKESPAYQWATQTAALIRAKRGKA